MSMIIIINCKLRFKADGCFTKQKQQRPELLWRLHASPACKSLFLGQRLPYYLWIFTGSMKKKTFVTACAKGHFPPPLDGTRMNVDRYSNNSK